MIHVVFCVEMMIPRILKTAKIHANAIPGDKEYRGDNQVLAGFFEYHNNNSNPPPLHKSEENYTYYYATINVSAITFILCNSVIGNYHS